MRIIVTKLGEEVAHSLTESRKFMEEETKQKPKIYHGNMTFYNTKEKLISKSTGFRGLKDSKSREIGKNREIEINQKKIHIPKIMTDKYLMVTSNQGILPNLPDNLENKQEKIFNKTSNFLFTHDKTMSSSNNSRYFNIKDIIKEKALVNLKKSIDVDRVSKTKLFTVNESNFRSNFQVKTDSDVVIDKLENVFVNYDNLNLIKYLNEKNMITEQFANKFSSLNDEKQKQCNKFCQLYYINKEKENLFNSLVKDKLKQQKKKQLSDVGSILTQIGSELNKAKNISNQYDIEFISEKRKDVFVNIHTEVNKNFWMKNNIHNLQRKTNKIRVLDMTKQENLKTDF